MVQWKLKWLRLFKAKPLILREHSIKDAKLRKVSNQFWGAIKMINKLNGVNVENLNRPSSDQRCWGAGGWVYIISVHILYILLEKPFSFYFVAKMMDLNCLFLIIEYRHLSPLKPWLSCSCLSLLSQLSSPASAVASSSLALSAPATTQNILCISTTIKYQNICTRVRSSVSRK